MIQNLHNSKVLVTGASGFLGSEIVRQCNENGTQVVSVGRREKTGVPNYHAVDLVNGSIPPNLWAGVSVVIHCAGLAHQFGAAGENASAFQAVNVRAVEKTIQDAAENGVKHFVLISSSSVYGPSSGVKSEQDECRPVGLYAVSKFEGEQVARRIATETGIHLTVLRMTTLYGENDRGNLDRLMRTLDRGRFVEIGSGENSKSLIHVSDAARACLLAANGCSNAKQTYNVAVPASKMSDVVSHLCEALNVRRPMRVPAWAVTATAFLLEKISLGMGPFGRLRQTIRKWLSDDVFSGERFQRDFHFEPRVDLRSGINRQVERFRDLHPKVERGSNLVKRVADLLGAVVLLAVFAVPMILIALLVKLTSKGPAIYWSDRVGANDKLFSMAKFRSMRIDTPEVATDQLNNSDRWITPIGGLLRKTSLDELPQLLNVLAGQMSFVGPRPALFNQTDLRPLRVALGVHELKPGITGWAAINGRDELNTEEKAEFDRQYLHRQSFWFDLKIMIQTGFAVMKRDGIRQADSGEQVPFIVIENGNEPGKVLLGTPNTINAVCLAKELIGRAGTRTVCLRPECISREELVQACGIASELVFVSADSDDEMPIENYLREFSEENDSCEFRHLRIAATGLDLKEKLVLQTKEISLWLKSRHTQPDPVEAPVEPSRV